MKKADVQIGQTYLVKVAGNLVPVKITHEHEDGGWVSETEKTGKQIRIKNPQRLHKPLDTTAKCDKNAAVESKVTPKEPKHMSCLDAAVKVLEEASEPMNTLSMFDAMVKKGYWMSEKATPQNTIYAAILREITTKGDASRFVKAERGKFMLAK